MNTLKINFFAMKVPNIGISILKRNGVSNIYYKIQNPILQFFKILISNIRGLYQPPPYLKLTLPWGKVVPQFRQMSVSIFYQCARCSRSLSFAF